ncbi:hypothetical protein [Rhizobium lusitanum]|nr:hypothetical protein [Rhizobium lusitanum]
MLPTSAAKSVSHRNPQFAHYEPPCAQHLEDEKVYLRERYFQEIGTWPTVDLRDGYFTVLRPQTNEEVHPILRREIFRLQSANKFEYFYKGEETFNGEVNTGPSDNWLEIAWCEAAGVAAILYRGEGIPARLKWFDAASPEEAIDQWCEEYVVPIPVTEDEEDEE